EILHALADLHCQGYTLPWARLFGTPPPRHIPLPGYPFERERHWVGVAHDEAARADHGPDPVDRVLGMRWDPAPLAGIPASTPERCRVVVFAGADTATLAESLLAHWPDSRIVRLDEPGDPADLDWAAYDGWIDVAGPGSASPETDLAPLQAWLRARASKGGRALCVTADVDGRAALYRLLQGEYARIQARLVRMETTDPDTWLEPCLEEFAAAGEDGEVRYIHGERRRARLVEVTSASPPKATIAWPDDGVLWVTGGTRGLGYACARHFVAEHGVRRVVLTGRDALPDRSTWDAHADVPGTVGDKVRAVRILESLGAQVRVSAVDLGDGSALAREMRSVRDDMGPIHGVLHCAGTTDPGTPAFMRKPPEAMRAVLAPKIDGLDALLGCLRATPPAFCVLFSSVSALSPSLAAGQLDYAMANA
ncbi:SDR family NAD(P)-dependent oxidoreductase, partial [Luteibacter sp. CQ10]|uniref:SDR family NAD(P)-dependent oxidoreductase n=1 Tax=Luteibacter sp. CQ10 TaxID=2805821 RepID=UPI0034A22FEC